VIPLAIGFLVSEESFAPALVLIATIAGLGAFAFLFLVGKIERIDMSESEVTTNAM
jgi:ACS family D-galactonate transporter-like MFS transporter